MTRKYVRRYNSTSSKMGKRERIWVSFAQQVEPEQTGTGSSYVPIITPVDWAFVLAGSQECTLMGIVFNASWILTSIVGYLPFALAIDEYGATADRTTTPGFPTFDMMHDQLMWGFVYSSGALDGYDIPMFGCELGVARCKARRILNSNQMISFYIGNPATVLGTGHAMIKGRALILRHG